MAGKVQQKAAPLEQVIPDHMLKRMQKSGFIIPQVCASLLLCTACLWHASCCLA